ncbi:DUF3156 family protein [Niallia sp. Krafla_26]|uniref:DUF3156 family protein n=1 Tax=Niallia sp. Krafla_26 TaxID=3064703 RepID=UPI003D17F562
MGFGLNVEQRARYVFKEIIHSFTLPVSRIRNLSFHCQEHGKDWNIEYKCEKSWFSRIYKLVIRYDFSTNLDNRDRVKINLDFSKKGWKQDHGVNRQFLKNLNNNQALLDLISSLDFEKVTIEIGEKRGSMTFILIPGSFVWTLVPPMHYYIRLKKEEIRKMKSILNLLEVETTKFEGSG